MPTIYEDLQKYFGYSSFLPYQEEIITDVISKKDVLAVLATGGGKSICYQLPSVHLNGVTIVISPLKALMKDQVDALTAHGIPAATINSSNYPEHRRIMDSARSGRLKLLYVSPEKIVQNSFMDFLCSITLSLIAVDEAHCISMWGHNFRPEYRELRTIHERFPSVPIIALTATAIPQVRDDIILQLGLKNPSVYIGSFHRKNLHYAIRPKSKNTINDIITYLSAHRDDSGIIYCLSRKTTEEVAEKLRSHGFNSHHFHASLTTTEKEEIQEKFIKGEIPVICATIAFGMGIDKPDVRFVINYDLPKDLESYYQETGRAGRDGDPADCILFYGKQDIITRRRMIESDSYSDPAQVTAAYHRLNDLIRFAESPECRKTHLMRYFGERITPEECSGCDICDSPAASLDGKEIASTAYQCIREVNGKFGITTIADILTGSRNKKILSRNLDQCHSFNSGTGHSATEWKEYLSQLAAMGYFSISDSQYPVISLTEKSYEIADPAVQITLRESKMPAERRQSGASLLIKESGDPVLFAALKEKRLELAREAALPPFIIMQDKTLRAISVHQPVTENDWAAIPGISIGKYQKYGEAFTDVIWKYQANTGTENQGQSERSAMPRQEVASHLTGETKNQELFDLLKQKRLELAKKADVPAFFVMHDRTLREVSVRQPLTEEDWLSVPGIGPGKFQTYGEPFTDVIRDYQTHNEVEKQGQPESPVIPKHEEPSILTIETENPELFALLKEKRLELSKEEGFPAYVIVQDKALREVSLRQPITEEEWISIQGIGAVRYQRYGGPFTDVIREYQARTGVETPQQQDATAEQERDSPQNTPESEIIRENLSPSIKTTEKRTDRADTYTARKTPSPFVKTTETEIDWVDVYIDRTYPDGCSPVANAQNTKELSIKGMNPGEVAAISGFSIKTITRHLLELSLSGEMDAWDCVSPFVNEQQFIEIAATLRAVTEEEAEPEVLFHLERFYSETEINITLIRLIHDKQKYHTIPSFPELAKIDRNSSHPTEFLPLLPDATGIFSYEALTGNLTDQEYHIRKSAAKILGYLGEPEAVAPLMTQLGREEKDSVKAEIIHALTVLQDRAHPQEISRCLHANAPTVCSAAIQYLKDSSPEHLYPEIANLLNNPSDTVRKATVWMLDECPEPDTADWLYRIIENDSSGYIRATAARILGKRENPADYATILALMDDADTCGYPGVVAGLAACDGKRAIPDITEQLISWYDPVRKAAITILVDLAPSLLPDLCQRAQDDSSAGVRKAFVWKLGTLGGAKAAKMIRSFASDPSPYVREAVACSLKKMTYTTSVACLQSMLSDTSPIVRRSAHEALMNMKAHYL